MKPSVKCNDAGVNGGDGRLSVSGSPGVGLTVHCRSWVLKYGQRETRMKRWVEKTAVVPWCAAELLVSASLQSAYNLDLHMKTKSFLSLSTLLSVASCVSNRNSKASLMPFPV